MLACLEGQHLSPHSAQPESVANTQIMKATHEPDGCCLTSTAPPLDAVDPTPHSLCTCSSFLTPRVLLNTCPAPIPAGKGNNLCHWTATDSAGTQYDSGFLDTIVNNYNVPISPRQLANCTCRGTDICPREVVYEREIVLKPASCECAAN
jgi:hypothetical protein